MNNNFTKREIECILDWYSYANSDHFHFGGPDVIIPAEAFLVNRLNNVKDVFEPNEDDLQIIFDWMSSAVERKYGLATFLFGFESDLYKKIKTLLG